MIGVLLCVYFSYHAMAGQRSLFRLLSLEAAIAKNVAKNELVTLERQLLESKVHAMRPGSVQKDLLEERVRETLGYKRVDEVMVLGN